MAILTLSAFPLTDFHPDASEYTTPGVSHSQTLPFISALIAPVPYQLQNSGTNSLGESGLTQPNSNRLNKTSKKAFCMRKKLLPQFTVIELKKKYSFLSFQLLDSFMTFLKGLKLALKPTKGSKKLSTYFSVINAKWIHF
jgi:hypothetical protein